MSKLWLLPIASWVIPVALVVTFAEAKPPVLQDQQQFVALQGQVATLQQQVTALQQQLSATNLATMQAQIAYICTNFISVQTTVTSPNPCSP